MDQSWKDDMIGVRLRMERWKMERWKMMKGDDDKQ